MKKFEKLLVIILIILVVLSAVTITTDLDEKLRNITGLIIVSVFNLYARDYFVKNFEENQNDFEQIANLITDYGNSYDSVDESDSRFIYFTPERYSSSGNIIFIVLIESIMKIIFYIFRLIHQ